MRESEIVRVPLAVGCHPSSSRDLPADVQVRASLAAGYGPHRDWLTGSVAAPAAPDSDSEGVLGGDVPVPAQGGRKLEGMGHPGSA